MTFDPDKPCPHDDFAAFVSVNRLVDNDDPAKVTGFAADIRVECAVCHEKFRWVGVPAGVLPNRPTTGVDEFELRAPIRPASSDPDFGLGIPGFAVTFHEGN